MMQRVLQSTRLWLDWVAQEPKNTDIVLKLVLGILSHCKKGALHDSIGNYLVFDSNQIKYKISLCHAPSPDTASPNPPCTLIYDGIMVYYSKL